MANRDFQCTLESPPTRRFGRDPASGPLPGRLGFGTFLGQVLAGLVLTSSALAATSPEPAASRLGHLETRLAWQSAPATEPPQTPETPTPESQPTTPQENTNEAIAEPATSPEASSTDPQTGAQPAAESPATATDTPPATTTSPTNVSRPGVPIPPDANAMAWRREILAVSLLGVMGVGCTIAAFFAVWILSKNLRPSDS